LETGLHDSGLHESVSNPDVNNPSSSEKAGTPDDRLVRSDASPRWSFFFGFSVMMDMVRGNHFYDLVRFLCLFGTGFDKAVFFLFPCLVFSMFVLVDGSMLFPIIKYRG
jgi:hypothetical protein